MSLFSCSMQNVNIMQNNQVFFLFCIFIFIQIACIRVWLLRKYSFREYRDYNQLRVNDTSLGFIMPIMYGERILTILCGCNVMRARLGLVLSYCWWQHQISIWREKKILVNSKQFHERIKATIAFNGCSYRNTSVFKLPIYFVRLVPQNSTIE